MRANDIERLYFQNSATDLFRAIGKNKVRALCLNLDTIPSNFRILEIDWILMHHLVHLRSLYFSSEETDSGSSSRHCSKYAVSRRKH